jgi:hypothetical protein
MPRPKREGWEAVTITVSAEVLRAMRMLTAIGGADMGTYADQAMRKGGLLDQAAYALGLPPPQQPPLTTKTTPENVYVPVVAPEPTAAPKPDAVSERMAIYLQIRSIEKHGFQASLARAVPGVKDASTVRHWGKQGIPLEHLEGVKAFLISEGIEPAKGTG